jgi:hypothetical protein
MPQRRWSRGAVRAEEVADEVLFASQVGAPGRAAGRAVGKVPSTRRPSGSAAVRSSGWPAAGPPCACGVSGGDAPAHSARAHGLPAAVGLAGDLDHREAVRSLRSCATCSAAPFAAAVGEQQAVIGVLVVGHQQAARGAAPVEREEAHAVVVHAHLHGLVGGAVAAVETEGRGICDSRCAMQFSRAFFLSTACTTHQGASGMWVRSSIASLALV